MCLKLSLVVSAWTSEKRSARNRNTANTNDSASCKEVTEVRRQAKRKLKRKLCDHPSGISSVKEDERVEFFFVSSPPLRLFMISDTYK